MSFFSDIQQITRIIARSKILLPAIAATWAIGFIMAVIFPTIHDSTNPNPEILRILHYIDNSSFPVQVTLGASAFLILFAAFRVFILFNKEFFEINKNINKNINRSIQERLRTLENKVENKSSKIEGISQPASKDIEEKINTHINRRLKSVTNKVTEDLINKRIYEKIGNDPVGDVLRNAINDLNSERRHIAFKTNVNLGFGLIFAAISIALLYSFAGNIKIDSPILNHEGAITAIYIRSSVAIFGGVFSFFFLQLYRNGTQDRKFYQNEITNLRALTAAVRLANYTDDTTNINNLVDRLAATERNFVLKKGETTQGVERNKTDLNMLLTKLLDHK